MGSQENPDKERPDRVPNLRADRLAALYICDPIVRFLRPNVERLPILMYHSVSDMDESTSHPYYRIGTDVRTFETHLKYLREQSYQTITLSEAVACLKTNAKECHKRVVLTFDDGYEDFYSQAFPLLQKFEYTATVFLPTAFIGSTRRRFNSLGCLTWNEVRELQTQGISFGSHTVTHPKLSMLKPADLEQELRESKEAIEQELDRPVKSFAYPYAFPETTGPFKERLKSVLEQTGYENGVCTIVGSATQSSDHYFMERLPINSCDDPDLFMAKIRGGYDWIHYVQYGRKLSKVVSSKVLG